MTQYIPISLKKLELKAFDPEEQGGKILVYQDLLRRMKSIQKEQKINADQFLFFENPITQEIKMVVA